jgi:hypothetical protein
MELIKKTTIPTYISGTIANAAVAVLIGGGPGAIHTVSPTFPAESIAVSTGGAGVAKSLSPSNLSISVSVS